VKIVNHLGRQTSEVGSFGVVVLGILSRTSDADRANRGAGDQHLGRHLCAIGDGPCEDDRRRL